MEWAHNSHLFLSDKNGILIRMAKLEKSTGEIKSSSVRLNGK